MRNVPYWPRQRARGLLRWAQKQNDIDLFRRAQVVALAVRSRSVDEICESVGCVVSTVSRTVRRFLASGREALRDGRRRNGPERIPDSYVSVIEGLLWQSPPDYGHARPTWTRELLVYVAEEQTGLRVSVASIGRILRRLGARRGRPKPVVTCPLSSRQRRRRLASIRRLIAELAEDEVAVYEDEVDIHLNPKLGLDWMHRGHQKRLLTPGKNEKAYLAGTLDARDGTVLWVGDGVKDSSLFIKMLRALARHYRKARAIHVILDNYGIHKSHVVWAELRSLGRIRLHFLPPYPRWTSENRPVVAGSKPASRKRPGTGFL